MIVMVTTCNNDYSIIGIFPKPFRNQTTDNHTIIKIIHTNWSILEFYPFNS
jgi:hypothetical protein